MANTKSAFPTLAAKKVTLGDITKTMGEWAAERGLDMRLVYDRSRHEDSYERILRPKRPPRLSEEERKVKLAKKRVREKRAPFTTTAVERAHASGFKEEFDLYTSNINHTKYGTMPHRFE